MKKFIKFLCCFNSLSANLIELLIIIISIICALLSMIGIGVIPWEYTSKIMEAFYILSLIFFLISIFKSFFFLYNRRNNKLEKNSKLFKISILLCFFELFECIFSIFMHFFIAAGALPDFQDQKSKQEDEIIDDDSNSISNSEIGYAIFSIIFNLLIWIVLLFLSLSDLVRIKLGINGSYNNYINETPINSTSVRKEINMVKHEKLEDPIYNEEVNTSNKTNNENKNKIRADMNEPAYMKAKSDYNYKFDYNTSSYTRNETEINNIKKYSYKGNILNKNCNSVDIIQKSKIDKEKYLDKYLEGYGANPYYSNYENKSVLNISSMNNSMNPGY